MTRPHFAENGAAVLGALTDEGQRILDTARLAADLKKVGAKAYLNRSGIQDGL